MFMYADSKMVIHVQIKNRTVKRKLFISFLSVEFFIANEDDVCWTNIMELCHNCV